MSSFLSALKARCEVVTLDGGKDYRRSSEEEPQEKWFELSEEGFDKAWAEVPGVEGTLIIRCRLYWLIRQRRGVWEYMVEALLFPKLKVEHVNSHSRTFVSKYVFHFQSARTND